MFGLPLTYIITIFTLVLLSCKENKPAQEANTSTDNNLKSSTDSTKQVDSTAFKAIIEFETKKFNFGKIKPEPVEHTFQFTNKGNAPLKILEVKASCGCTTPDWTKAPIEPNQGGFIKVRFDPKGKKVKQKKTVTVTSNTEPKQTVLEFEAEIIEK